MQRMLATALPGSAIATSAQAWQTGDILVRAGAAGVFPAGDGTHPAAGPAANVEADDAWRLGISLTWMATGNTGVGVPGA